LLHLAHIINPFRASTSSDLHAAQPITFESIRRAKIEVNGKVHVDILCAVYEDDLETVPSDFIKTDYLRESVLDKQPFSKLIKLPFIKEILNKAYQQSKADYLIYTNIDIGLYPDFYSKVAQFIQEGYDAFMINRRRLKPSYNSVSQLEEIYKEKGKSHPGFDCFVFHRNLVPNMCLEGICIGVPFIEITFSQNLFALAQNSKVFENEILTFHIGEEIFAKHAPKEYFNYNQKQFWKNVNYLASHLQLKKIPYSHLPMVVRLLKWALHPCYPIRLMLLLEWKRIKRGFEQ
jgi:hypothetical protein